MSLLVKSVLSTIFFVSGILAVWSMFTLMGRPEGRLSGTLLRRLHKTFGFVFVFLLFFLSYICAKFVRIGGDSLPLRAIDHSVMSLALLAVILLKMFIVQFYRGLLRFVPVLGIITIILAFLAYGTSAGFFFLVQARQRPTESTASLSHREMEGRGIFERQCAICHNADKIDPKLGPGLKGLLKRETLPVTGRPATVQTVRKQLLDPAGGMPSFKSTLSEKELDNLLAYLATL